MATMIIMRRVPLVFSIIFKHLINGPPQPSWNLKIHLAYELLRSFFESKLEPPRTIEETQTFSLTKHINNNIPHFIVVKKIISHKYRIDAQEYIEKIVKPYAIVIDPIWKTLNNEGINCELVMNENYEEENNWEKEKIVIFLHGGAYIAGNFNIWRDQVCKMVKTSGARFLSVGIRLAPQQPFPAALCDALAAYLYLTDPPNDSGIKAYKSEQIFICGDSSGGGLVISLGLVIRDLGLPLPAGLISLSPWVDLTHSMPSFIENKLDTLPKVPGFIKINPNSNAYNDFKVRAEIITRNIQQQSDVKLVGDDSLKRIGQPVSCYIGNEGLAIPYVSPMLAESLGGLPPMLIVTGNIERLRDEAIYISYRAANPEKYRLPAYEIDFDNSRFKTPTKVTLEVFDEMFHSFQGFSKHGGKRLYQSVGHFISGVTREAATLNNTPWITALKISYNGETQPLDESSIEHILKWHKVGVFPDV